jgi:hypothetical protein
LEPSASAASWPSGTQGNAPRQLSKPARRGVGRSVHRLCHPFGTLTHSASVPARALRVPHPEAARLAAETAGATPLRAAGRCLNTLRLARPQRRARARWAPPAIPTERAAHQTSRTWKRAAGGGRRPGEVLVSGEARHVTCRPTLDCSSTSASAFGMAPSRARWSRSGQGQPGTVLCIYSQTVDAAQEHAVEQRVVGNVAPELGTVPAGQSGRGCRAGY